MQTENVLIARICHDLITPCNAINLGIEAYEMSEDQSLLTCIKESASKANVILKFFREVFQEREATYLYPVSFLLNLLTEFLRIYNIEFSLMTSESQLVSSVGMLILYDAVIMKEVMPLGGKAMFNVRNDHVNIIYTGEGIVQFDTNEPETLNYKNILRFKLLKQAKEYGFNVTSALDQKEGRILQVHS